MRITLINQFYPPDLAPTGHMAASLAEHRAALGDTVTVVTGRGRYVPESETIASSQGGNPRVIRLWTSGLGKRTALRRIADYASFYIQAAVVTLALPRQDLMISLTTPPFIGLVAALHKRFHRGTKLILWSMDCYPEVLERSGTIPIGGWIGRFMRWLNQRLFKNLDHLVCLDSAMLGLLSDQYSILDDAAIPSTVIPNWERADAFPPDLDPPQWEPDDQLDLGNRFVVLYLGNAGPGHRFEAVFEAAQRLSDEPVAFLFVGGGSQWNQLKVSLETAGLSNLHLCRYVPKDMTPSVMTLADCALITLRDGFLGVISPSKLHANLAMGLPIIYIGPEGGNVDDAIRRFECGISLRHGQVEALVALVRKLRDQPAFAQAMGARARGAFEAAYVDTKTLPIFDRVIDGFQD